MESIGKTEKRDEKVKTNENQTKNRAKMEKRVK
jgi:hypothetical protein